MRGYLVAMYSISTSLSTDKPHTKMERLMASEVSKMRSQGEVKP